MIAAIVSGNIWFLNWVHVMCGVLWTGIDLFMGFVLGPVLRDSTRQCGSRSCSTSCRARCS